MISNFGVKYFKGAKGDKGDSCGLISNFGVKYLSSPRSFPSKVVV